MSPLPRPLQILLRPWTVRDDEPGRLGLGAPALVVALVGTALAASLVLSGAVLAPAVPGTATVPNPDYPGERFCDDDLSPTTFAPCAQPENVTVDLGDVARETATGLALGALAAVLLAWPLVAGIGYLLTGGTGEEAFGPTLARTAWGVVPLSLVAVARPVAVALAAPTLDYPGTPDAVRSLVREVLLGFGLPSLAAVSALAFCWSAYVFAGTLAADRETSLAGGAVAAGVPMGLLGGDVALGTPLLLPDALPLALVFLAIGTPLLAVPRAYIEFQKSFELIGFRNTGAVEPSDWYVALHRVGGALAVLFTLGVLGLSTHLL